MTNSRYIKLPGTIILAACLAAAPALAGNGNGNGGGNAGGNGGGHGGNGKGASISAKASDRAHKSQGAIGSGKNDNLLGAIRDTLFPGSKADPAPKSVVTTKNDASSKGKLNGFLNASPQALANAAPNSAIGLVAGQYADTLGSSLTGDDDAATLAEVRAALEAASNKPLTAETIAEINARLAEQDPELAAMIDSYDGGPEALAEDILAAEDAEVVVIE